MIEHVVRETDTKNEDCCGDRSICDVRWICSCGERGCDHHMKNHIFELHRQKQLTLEIG